MAEKFSYRTSGTCSRAINFTLEDDGTVKDVSFEGGCNGNLQGVSRLIDGMKAQDVIDRCSGIRCGFKSTSCPDQLARALKEALEKLEEK
ncbi:MAG: TIGR03905 family TSCPD domain-containing protein [Firmicutes bacterium]|nr:TIGR03905 family TSCPD domain-containing protein [Bacillota bacterium]